MEWRIRIPKLPSAIVGAAVALAVVGTFMVADKTVLHWYSQDTDSNAAEVDSLERSVDGLDSRLQVIETPSESQGLDRVLGTLHSAQIGRLTNAVAILSLVQGYGGFQTSTSPAGRACIAYLLTGAGSITDCGFQHVD